jgi:formylglycine-generating enzyme required for sulfatase activity
MATQLNSAGISRSGASGSYSYTPIGSPQHPVTFVNWGDAARFANWLKNGQPTGLQTAGTTEDGSYTLNGATSEAALLAITRNAGATWVIPSESEWYKAAYHQNDGVTNNYWTYPTESNSVPVSEPPAGGANSANFRDGTTGFAVTGSTSYDSNQNYLTDVGAYASSSSPYGTFDQAGNAWEWNEALISDSNFRGIRAGSWFDGAFSLGSFSQGYEHANGEYSTVGFRVALVPEPSTLVLATLGLLGTLFGRRGRRAKRRQTPVVTFPRG